MRCRGALAGRPRDLVGWCGCCVAYCPVALVILLIVWILLSYEFFLVIPLYQAGYRVDALGCGGGCVLLLALLLVTFLRATFTPPGFVQSGWEKAAELGMPDVLDAPEDSEEPMISQTAATSSSLRLGPGLRHPSPEIPASVVLPVFESKSTTGALRFCRKCRVYKPDRAHHCSDCNRCVLKMDHHCPWINNCVGFANQKYFILFISYVPVAGAFVAGTTGPLIFRQSPAAMAAHPLRYINLAGVAIVSATFAISLFFFTAFHCRLLWKNRTTIESFEKGATSPGLWDHGPARNYAQVFGARLLPALLPVPTTPGSGYFFPAVTAAPWTDP